MKKFLLTLLFIILLAIGTGIYYLSRTLNAQSYQQQIITAVSELTGRKLTVSGQTSLHLFPYPTIVMTGIYITNQAGSDKANMLTADNLKVEIDWASLFKTPLVVKNIEIAKPVLYLERLETNRANWDLPFFSAPDENLNDARILGTVSTIASTKVENLNIKGGSLIFFNKITGQTTDVQNINGTLTVDALKGPYTFKGSAHYNKFILNGSFDVGRIRNDRPATLKFNVQEKNSQLAVDFTGEITNQDPKSFFRGDGTFSLKNSASLLDTLGIPALADILKKEAVGNFALEVTPLIDTLKNFNIRFGNDDAAFAITTFIEYHTKTATTPAYYTGDLAVNTLDYAVFKPYFDKMDWSFIQEEKIGKNIALDLHIDRLLVNAETLRGFEAKLSYTDKILTLEDGKITLPGNTNAAFTARTGIQNNKPYFLINGDLSTKMAHPLLAFLNLDIQQVPQNLLTTAEVKGSLTFAPEFASLSLKSFKIDTTDGSGTIDWAPKNPKQLEIDLTFNNLNLDRYTGWVQPSEKINVENLPEVLNNLAINTTNVSDWNVGFKTNFKALTWHALPITQGTATGSLRKGVLKLDNSEFSGVATATLNLSGEVTGIGTQIANINSMNFSFAAAQLPIFMGRAGLDSTLPIFKQATNTKVAGSINGANNTWKTNILFQLSDASIKINGGIAEVEDALKFQNLNFNISHPSLQRFLTSLNVQNKYFKNLEGTLRTQGVLNGASNDWRLTQGETTIGIQKLTGEISYTTKEMKKITAILNSPIFDAERFIPQSNILFDQSGKLSKAPFDLTDVTDWDIDVKLTAGRLTYKVIDLNNANLAFRARDRVFTLADFSGKQRNATASVFKANGTFSWVSEPIIKMSIDLTQTPVRPDFMIVNKFSFGGGKVSVRGDFTAGGKSPSEMMGNLSGNGSSSFIGGQIIGTDLGAIDPLIKTTMTQNESQTSFDTQIARLLQSGKTTVNSLGGGFTISQGIVRFMDMSLKTPTATANPTQITWDLPARTLDVSIPVKLNAYPQFPPIALNVSVDGNKQLYTSDYADLSNAVSGVVKHEISTQEEEQRQQQVATEQVAVANRQNEIKQAITQATTLVKQTDRELQSIGNEMALILLQNANDALAIVNQLAIRENLTTEQENTLLEQSRLAILKANAAKEEAQRDGTLDYRKTLATLEIQARAMLQKMQSLQKQKSEIAIIPRMIEASIQSLAQITSAHQKINRATKETQAALLASATNAYGEIEEAYANVMRFDDQLAPRTDDTPKPIRGKITRKGQ